MFDSTELWRRLEGSRFARGEWVSETDSTNADLVAVVRDHVGDPHSSLPGEQVRIADFQLAGRGRRDRQWIAPPESSLMMSILVNRGTVEPHLLVTALALAAAEACGSVAGVDVELKWPNDLVVEDRKLAGILAEVPSTESPWVVIGIGLNVSWPDGFPAEIAETATTLSREQQRNNRVDAAIDRVELAASTLLAFERNLARHAAEIVTAYRARSATIARRVRVERFDGVVTGTVTALREDGCLELTTASGIEIISVGDVVHLRTDET